MKVGVVIGRFQSGIIHIGHGMLIDYVATQSDRVLIVVGESRVYIMDAPNPIIEKEWELIKKAGEQIAFLSRTDIKNN